MYNNQISNNYSETAQNETVQSFRTIEEPSHSTQSSLRDAVTVDSDVILPYICNWQTERRRGGLNLPRDDDERSFSGKCDTKNLRFHLLQLRIILVLIIINFNKI